MDKDNNNHFEESNEELDLLYLLFIDEERNKDLEKRFNSYINKYFNFDKKETNDTENMNNENKENKGKKENKTEIKVIKFAIC